MPRPDLTDITIVLDRSGSMQAVKEATIESFNGFLASQRAAPGTARITLVQFDDQYELVYESEWIDQADQLNNRRFLPRGTTALLDAMGRSIIETGRRLAAMPAAERPGTVLFVILTDGYENASRQYRMVRISEMIAEQRKTYSWQFIFLAANQDAIATAAGLGINSDQALTFAPSHNGVQASFEAVGREVTKVRRRRAAGEAVACSPEFNERDRKKARR